jgi:hypothetical protein
MNQTDASNYCQNMGSRLPTSRELALWSTQYGAKVSNTPQNGYYQVQGTDNAGQLDTFYYQVSGYQTPSGRDGEFIYWSSSVVPGDSGYAYGLYGETGNLENVVSRSDDFIMAYAFRCAR